MFYAIITCCACKSGCIRVKSRNDTFCINLDTFSYFFDTFVSRCDIFVSVVLFLPRYALIRRFSETVFKTVNVLPCPSVRQQ